MAVGTIVAHLDNVLREQLAPGIHEHGYAMDSAFRDIMSTSESVVRDEYGRGNQIKKTYCSGVSGGAKFRDANGTNVITGVSESWSMWDTPATYPGIDDVTSFDTFQLTVDLIRQDGNLFLPAEQLRIDRYSAAIGDIIGKQISGLAKLLALHEAAMWFSTDTTTKALGDLGDTSATVANKSGDTASMTVNLSGTSASGRVHRFTPGMLIDLYDSTGATKRNIDFTVVVSEVDALNNSITITRADGNTFQVATTLNGAITYAGAGGDNDVIVIRDSVGKSPNSLETWIKDTGSLFGISVDSHPEFKSYIVSVAAALSESKLNQYYYRFWDAYPGVPLERALTTNGVLLKLLDDLDGYNSVNANSGRMRYDRNGETMKPSLGFTEFTYSFGGRPVTITTSIMLQRGSWYGMSLADSNIKRYVPAALPGAGRDGRVDAEVEFIGPIVGSSGNMLPVFSAGGRLTNFVQFPLTREWQLLPERFNFMKLHTITEI